MAEFSALPLFTDAYLADTRHLTTLQHGAYLLMLMTAWRMPDCSLPDDDVFLARITGLDKRTWRANKEALLAFWRLNEQQRWVQGRLLDERNYVDQKRSKNAKAGKASALKRLNRGPTDVQPDVNQTATPTPTPLSSEAKASSDTKPPPPPQEAAGGGGEVVGAGPVLDAELIAEATKITKRVTELLGNCKLYISQPAIKWLQAGAIYELDIEPVIRQHVEDEQPPPRTCLSYFDRQIAARIAYRQKPLTPEESHGTSVQQSGRAIRNGRHPSGRALTAPENFALAGAELIAEQRDG